MLILAICFPKILQEHLFDQGKLFCISCLILRQIALKLSAYIFKRLHALRYSLTLHILFYVALALMLLIDLHAAIGSFLHFEPGLELRSQDLYVKVCATVLEQDSLGNVRTKLLQAK